MTDRSKGLYIDTLNNKKYKIQDAIQKGLVVAEEVQIQKDEGVSNEIITNQESTFTVIGVLHPTTGEKLTVSKVSAEASAQTHHFQTPHPHLTHVYFMHDGWYVEMCILAHWYVGSTFTIEYLSSVDHVPGSWCACD